MPATTTDTAFEERVVTRAADIAGHVNATCHYNWHGRRKNVGTLQVTILKAHDDGMIRVYHEMVNGSIQNRVSSGATDVLIRRAAIAIETYLQRNEWRQR